MDQPENTDERPEEEPQPQGEPTGSPPAPRALEAKAEVGALTGSGLSPRAGGWCLLRGPELRTGTNSPISFSGEQYEYR